MGGDYDGNNMMNEYSPVIQKENSFRRICAILATNNPKAYYNASASGHLLNGYITGDFASGERIPIFVNFIDASRGVFEFTLTPEQIAALDCTLYKLRILLTLPSGDRVTLIESQSVRVKP